MKSVIKALAVLIITALLFSGCNAGVISFEPDTEIATVTQQLSETQTETQTTAKKADKKETTEKASETEAQTTTETQSKKETTEPAKENASKPEKQASEKQKKKKNKKDKEETTAAQTTTESENICTITIECTDIFNNLDDLKEGYKQYLPSDGYILHEYACSFDEGDTVYDVLKRASAIYGIRINARDTVYGTYIAGINNIEEKIAGKTSGWVYYVNGKFAQYSCGKFKVSKGDKILFHYSCHP